MKLLLPLVLFTNVILCTPVFAQDKSGIIFYKVKPDDFLLSNITVDTSYGAVIIADIGKSYFEGNYSGWFTLMYEHKRRVLIIDKKGFDLATVEIPLYRDRTSNMEEKLESIKATTYNLENGKVVETKLDKDDIFKDKLDDNHLIRKFTMPAVKEGSIIEYSYTVSSEFLFNLQPWNFQGGYPRMWSEYNVSIPSFFRYVTLSQGYFPFHIKTAKETATTYAVREQNRGGRPDETFKIPSNDVNNRWVVRNIPAMKEERFTSSLSNHFSKLEFQLAAYNPPLTPKSVMTNWQTISGELLEDNRFGADLATNNNWLSNDVNLDMSKRGYTIEEAKRIFKYVQANFKSKGIKGIYLSQSLKETFKNKNGHVADINMLLTSILIKKGYKASPVILSTRSNGLTSDLYPLLNKYNYVICKLTFNNESYFLDASNPFLGFNKLATYCYNGEAKTISKPYESEYFLPERITESKVTNAVLELDEKNPTCSSPTRSANGTATARATASAHKRGTATPAAIDPNCASVRA